MITEASGVLSRAGAGLGGGGVYFKQVTIVIPHHWDESHCRVKLVAPGRGVAYQVWTYETFFKLMKKYFLLNT